MIELKYCWKQLSEHVKKQIVSHHRGVSTASFPDRLADSSYWSSYETTLTDDERKLLNWWVTHQGSEILAHSALKRARLPLDPVKFRLTLVRLRQRGVAYTVRQSNGRAGYAIPEDVQAAWLSIAFPIAHEPTRDVHVDEMARPGLLFDVFQLLTFIDRKPIELTADGSIQPRDEQKLSVELELDDTVFAIDWIADWVDGDTASHVVLNVAREVGLIDQDGRTLTLNRDAVNEWLALSHRKAVHRLYLCIRAILLRTHPQSAAFIRWFEQQSGWIGDNETTKHWARIYLHALIHFGWVDRGYDGERTYWRWSLFSPFTDVVMPADARGFVQPNFEWFLPWHFPLSSRWEVAQFADLMQQDQMCLYDINFESIKRGLHRGWTADALIAFMEKTSVHDVPQNVIATIRQWEKELSGIRFERVLIMTCMDKSLEDAIVKDDIVQQYIRRKLGEGVYVVADETLPRLKNYFTEKNIRMLLTESTLPEKRKNVAKAHKEATDTWLVESVYPKAGDMFSGLARLPKLWTSALREYHESTRRDIVQRAIELQLPIEYEDGDGGVNTLFPIQLLNDNGEWKVEGSVQHHNDIAYFPINKIARIRILLPL